jgi:murein DD-endopeptidase MepM/ murein hydrolase activator NlpD
MHLRALTTLGMIGLLGGCTSFAPVAHDGSRTWLEARQAASGGTAVPASSPPAPVIATGPIEPLTAGNEFDPRPLPPLQGQPAVSAGPAQDWSVDRPVIAAPAAPIVEPEPAPRVSAPLRAEPAPVAAPAPVVAETPPEPRPAPVVTATPAPRNVGDAAQASADLPPPSLSNVGFLWPASGEVRDGRSPGAPGHVVNGLTIQARAGEPFVAAENGIVVFAGDSMQTYGNMVVVRHDGDYTTAYGHAERLDVAVGDVVRRGQRLGLVGSTGDVDTAQLYFEMRVGSQVVDPRHYLMGSPRRPPLRSRNGASMGRSSPHRRSPSSRPSRSRARTHRFAPNPRRWPHPRRWWPKHRPRPNRSRSPPPRRRRATSETRRRPPPICRRRP